MLVILAVDLLQSLQIGIDVGFSRRTQQKLELDILLLLEMPHQLNTTVRFTTPSQTRQHYQCW